MGNQVLPKQPLAWFLHLHNCAAVCLIFVTLADLEVEGCCQNIERAASSIIGQWIFIFTPDHASYSLGLVSLECTGPFHTTCAMRFLKYSSFPAFMRWVGVIYLQLRNKWYIKDHPQVSNRIAFMHLYVMAGWEICSWKGKQNVKEFAV